MDNNRELNETEKFMLVTLEAMSHKIRKGKCTTKEIEAVSKALSSEMSCLVSANDLSEILSKDSTKNIEPRDIHNAINRNRYGNKLRPVREYLYKIKELLPILPQKWFKY